MNPRRPKTAATSGGLGDIVFAIPAMRLADVEQVYVKENHYVHGTLYSAIKRFLEYQDFKVLPTSGLFPVGKFEPGLQYDYNLDRRHMMRGRTGVHIVVSYHKFLHQSPNGWKRQWVHIPNQTEIKEPYTAIHVTSRYRDHSKVNWSSVLSRVSGRKIFLGFQDEWLRFCTQWKVDLEWFAVDDIYQMAQMIKGSQALYCNQSVGLALAQGLAHSYFLEKKPGKVYCIMNVENEHLL